MFPKVFISIRPVKPRPFPLNWLLLCLAGVAASLPVSRADTGESPAPPAIRAGTSFEFDTVEGAAYLVEGRVDAETWTSVAGPFFGDGTRQSALLPAGITPASYPEWRVRPVNAANYGGAITGFEGKTLALNDGGRARQVIFFPVIQGIRRGVLKTDAEHARSFTWKATRSSGTDSVVELTFTDGTTSRISLQFSTAKLGVYELRDRGLNGAVQVTEGGGFSLHAGRIRDEADQSVLPGVLDGQSLLLEEGGRITVLEFDTSGQVTQTRPDGTTETAAYEYNRSNPGAGELRIIGPELNRPVQRYQLTLGTQATGTFARVPVVLPGGIPLPGVLPQPGTFNIPTRPVVINSTNGPPTTLGGKVLELGGDDPVTLTFHEDGTGNAKRENNGTVEVTPFTYDYSPTDEDEASLALTYPGAVTDRVEDYDLDFSSDNAGSYQISSYEGGELAKSTGGSFNSNGP